ncbi:MAG: hypothetical protein CML20_08870 [Rheinheimera sp.]|uniref:ATP-binding cassette domain-containing protein n=1 Tax=Arsukibacterium sp. UBA3155 TaxID=1946058 RepID=UPI000C92B6B8|nr:ABC transporter ATP-binding protein [Arsukibacterium sp. UBA3155]MAD74883.1 hypothetical protein [Rheinheimera sp.]|tara:strand:- start:122593 stop:124362 length:1770 start_codon:yes stop_codon:yes gene_type:complete
MISYLKKILKIAEVTSFKYITIVLFISISGLLDALVIGLIPISIAAAFEGSSPIISKLATFGIPVEHIAEIALFTLLIASIIKVLVSLSVQYWVVIFISNKQVQLTKKVVTSFFSLSYLEYLKQEPSKLIQTVVTSIPRFIEEGLHSSIRLVTEIVVFTLIIATLIIIDTHVAIFLFSMMMVLGILFAFVTRKRSTGYSKEMLNAQENVIESARQSIDGFVETKVHNLGSYFVNKIDMSSHRFATTGAKFYVLQAIPRYLLEFVVVLSFVIGSFWAFSTSASLVDVGAIAGAFGIGIVRLIPVINNIINYVNKIRFSEPLLNDIELLLDSLDKSLVKSEDNDKFLSKSGSVDCVTLKGPNVDSFEMLDLAFSYGGGKNIFEGIDFKLVKGDVLGIVGPSGTGKTTLLKVMLGLLPPGKGTVKVNGVKLVHSSSIDFSREHIMYIPQSCFLLSASLSENVALGLAEPDIDLGLVKSSLDRVGLNSLYVDSPEGLNRHVGDSGRMLSGGQKHRLAISRVLYFDKSILILDEPSAALDLDMTNAIGRLIQDLSKDRIVIVVTHDQDLMKFCTKKLELNKSSNKGIDNEITLQ